jgi:hypothetical protein
MALQFTLKTYLKAKEELWKFKYFTTQKYNLQKNPLQEKPKSFKISHLYNYSLSSFNTSQNILSFKKCSYNKNRPIIYYHLVGAKIP